MQIIPRTREEAWKIIYSILNQGDSRYNDPESEYILVNFILKKAVSLEEKEIPFLNKPGENDFKLMHSIQGGDKYIAKELLKLEGFKENEIFFERSFFGSRPDVIAESQAKKKIILVECCSCRINKIIDYLSEVNEVWVSTRGESPWETTHYLKEKIRFFIFKKGPNWQDSYKRYQEELRESIKDIQNKLNSLERI